jgi:hypothetical protein
VTFVEGTYAMDSELGILRHGGEFMLLVTEPILAEGFLFTIVGDVTPAPSRISVQIAEGLHVDLAEGRRPEELLDGYYWRFMNHSCEPNAAIRNRDVFALRNIDPWEQVTFNYNTTEFEMAEPFDCRCGSQRCIGRVRGFHFLDRSTRERLKPLLASHLLTHLDAPEATEARL